MTDGNYRVSIVVGNPKPESRTRVLAEMLVQKLFGQAGAQAEVIELASHQHELFAWPSAQMDGLTQKVAGSDLVVFATPTYKASYTGLMKCFLDRYPTNGLSGTLALVVMTGGGEGHSLAPNTTLVPLLLELGASVLGRGIYFNIQQFDNAESRLEELHAELAGVLRRTARLQAVVSKAGGNAA